MADESAILRTGDPWLEHYRGSKYHCSPTREAWWALPAGMSKVSAKAGFEELVDLFLTLRPDGGSFRITETGAVIAKIPPHWEPVYVGEYDVPMEFEHVDVLGAGVQPLDIWPSFYDGARYSLKRDQLWWKNPLDGVWQRTVESLPMELDARLKGVKPDGGSIRVTENGKVLVLITPQPLPRHLKPQYEALTTPQKRLIEVKVRSTDRLPILLGNYHEGFTLRLPQRLTDPLSAEEESSLMSFLMRYGRGVDDIDLAPFDADDEIEDAIDKEEYT